MEQAKNKKAQSIMEYMLIMTVVIAAIISVGFLDNVKGIFRNYFDSMVSWISALP
jgi:hypothetical protein